MANEWGVVGSWITPSELRFENHNPKCSDKRTIPRSEKLDGAPKLLRPSPLEVWHDCPLATANDREIQDLYIFNINEGHSFWACNEPSGLKKKKKLGVICMSKSKPGNIITQ